MGREKRLEVRVSKAKLCREDTVTRDLARLGIGVGQKGIIKIPSIEISEAGDVSFFWTLPGWVLVNNVTGDKGGKQAQEVVLKGTVAGPGKQSIKNAKFEVKEVKGIPTVIIELAE